MSYTEPRRIVPAFSEKDVADMLKLIELSPFPSRPPIPSKTPWELGIDYDYLKSLKEQFTTSWSAKSLEERIQKLDHFIVTFDLAPGQLDLHYVHAKSPRADAIPLLLLHGWPGMITLSSTISKIKICRLSSLLVDDTQAPFSISTK